MRNQLICLFFFLCFGQTLHAQLGVLVSYDKIGALGWEKVIQSQRISTGEFRAPLSTGIMLGFDTQIPLNSCRVVFVPSLHHSRYIRSWYTNFETFTADLSLNILQINWATNFYILDLNGTKNEHREAPKSILHEGLFVQIAPGVSWLHFFYKNHEMTHKSKDMALNLNFGFGLDLFISRNLTVSPFFNVKNIFNANWKNLDVLTNGVVYNDGLDNTTNVSQLEAGIKMAFRLKRSQETGK